MDLHDAWSDIEGIDTNAQKSSDLSITFDKEPLLMCSHAYRNAFLGKIPHHFQTRPFSEYMNTQKRQ